MVSYIAMCNLDRTTGTEGAIFINGIDDTQQAVWVLYQGLSATDAIHIGVEANGYNRFNGNIDEVSHME